MKKVWFLLLLSIYIMSISACSKQNNVSDTMSAIEENSESKEERIWHNQEIISMFNNMREYDWEYIDCITMPDQASNCIGAVLYWDRNQETSNVAFFNASGYAQRCGTYAKMAGKPNFTYLGDGTVTFMLETDNGTLYNYMLTISIKDSNVNFKAKDNLSKDQ